MEAFAESLTILSIVVSMSVCAVLIARIYRKNSALDPKITNKLRKQQEEYITEVERKNRSLQNKLNSMQKGPQIEDTGDPIGMIPELLDGIEQSAPKWLGSIIKTVKSNPSVLKIVTDYAKNNPEKAGELVQSIVGKVIKVGSKTKSANDESVSGL